MCKCSLVTLVFKFRYKYYSPTPHQAYNTNNYGRALMSVPPQAIAPNPHTNLLSVYEYIHIANKMRVQQRKKIHTLDSSI
jgi:hypothetical protein